MVNLQKMFFNVLYFVLISACTILVDGRYLNYENDGCSVVVNSSINSNFVRTVYLGCKQGNLLWTRPEGSILTRFSMPTVDGLNDDDKYRLCIKFIEDHSTQVLVYKMKNGVLQNMFDNQQPDRLNCISYNGKHKMSIFLQSKPFNGDKNNRYHAGFSYVIEKEKEDKAPECGICTTQEVLKEYCSSDFIFHGTLLRSMPDKESLEFSLYGIVRRPIILGNIISAFRPKSSLQTARVFSNCNLEYVSKMAHKEFMVISKTRIGVADLRCAVEYSSFLKIVADYEDNEHTPCQLQHKKKINPYSMR